jgi:hypothetical protein
MAPAPPSTASPSWSEMFGPFRLWRISSRPTRADCGQWCGYRLRGLCPAAGAEDVHPWRSCGDGGPDSWRPQRALAGSERRVPALDYAPRISLRGLGIGPRSPRCVQCRRKFIPLSPSGQRRHGRRAARSDNGRMGNRTRIGAKCGFQTLEKSKRSLILLDLLIAFQADDEGSIPRHA